MITAALEGELDDAAFSPDPIFGFAIPAACPGVPSEVLNPCSTWADPVAYKKKAYFLATLFIKNFEKYKDGVSAEVLAAQPKL
jgi:phosphoenolpyruvate carboxykinase (ATP)